MITDDLAAERASHADLLRWVSEYERIELNRPSPKFEILPPIIADQFRQSPVDGPGCYAIYVQGGSLWYIGMAEDRVSNRALSHMRPKVQESPFWKDRGPFEISIVKTERPWEPHSLEAFLTYKKIIFGNHSGAGG
ncbi:hypothetical protein BH10PLA2_BH10PLA2_03580 [soil metagenome]